MTIKVVPPEQNTTRYQEGVEIELCAYCSGHFKGAAHAAAEGKLNTFGPGRYTRAEVHDLIERAARILRKGDVPTTRSEMDSLATLELWLVRPEDLRG